MKETWNAVLVGIAGVGGVIGGFLGGFDGFVYALVAFTIIDYATGLMGGIVEKKLSSEIGFKGIFKKILIFTMVAVGNMIDKHIIGEGDVMRSAVCFFYLANEGVSIIENASRIGLPIPEKMKEILMQLRKKEGGGNPPNDSNGSDGK
jgi:toxin secretion/phage lysis holin